MLRFVVGSTLVVMLAGCAARTGAPAIAWQGWTINPRTSQVVRGDYLAPSYEACQAANGAELAQAETLCRSSANPICPDVLSAGRAAQCAPVTIAAPAAPSGTDRVLQVLAILAAARSGHSSAAVLSPIQWNAYGPGVHMDATGRAVELVPR